MGFCRQLTTIYGQAGAVDEDDDGDAGGDFKPEMLEMLK